jgi:hypothetical protein
MLYFKQYKSDCGYSSYDNVPIQELSRFRSEAALEGRSYRIRYRGPRMATRVQDGRTKHQCQLDCLKKHAVTFSAYYSHRTNKTLDILAKKSIIASSNNKTRENTMTQNLSITINGLEYVAKDATASIANEQKDIEINNLTDEVVNLGVALKLAYEKIEQKDKEINDLQEGFDFDFGLMTLDNEKLECEIKDLKNELNTVMIINRELMKSIEQKNNRIQELTEALQDIVYTAEKAL